MIWKLRATTKLRPYTTDEDYRMAHIEVAVTAFVLGGKNKNKRKEH